MTKEEEEILLLRKIVAEQASEIAELKQTLVAMTEKFNSLLVVLQKQGVKKTSHNSSLAPSSDFFKSTKSLRPPSSRKTGGQPNHDGTTLKMTSTPDQTIDLKSSVCEHCKHLLSGSDFVLNASRQVVEIPPIRPTIKEYRQFSCICPHCQGKNTTKFPEDVNAPIQYGNTVEALVCYLSVYQYLPFARLQSLLASVFQIHLSQGTIGNILERFALKGENFYQSIKEEIGNSAVVGSDETGAKVNGEKWWIWVWQNVRNTFIVPSADRGSETIDRIWKDGLPNAILLSDRWAAQLKSNAKGHQLCLAHLLRNIIFLEESDKHPFATQFKQLLLNVYKIREEIVEKQIPYQEQDKPALDIEQRLNELLTIIIDKEKDPNTLTFQTSMIKNRNYLFPCLYNLDVPPDNNTSEQAIRNIKVKQKVSGQFKSGQNAFCVIRSIIDTLRKREMELLPCLNLIAAKQPV
jgi:transposase